MIYDFERVVLYICLYLRIEEFASKETLCIENCIQRIRSKLVLRRVTDQTSPGSKGDNGRRHEAPFFVGNGFEPIIAEYANTTVGDPKINANSWGHVENIASKQ